MLSDQTNCSQILPKCVKKAFRRRGRITQTIKAENCDKSSEITLCHHFKCSNFHLKCYFTTADSKQFQDHLVNHHRTQSFFCVYCHKLNDENKKNFDAKQLTTHLIEAHRHRRYQCNLCLYRAISAEHVNIHQTVIHSDIHESTLKNKHLNGKTCKVLECPPVTINSAHKPVPSEVSIYENHKTRRINNDETHNKDYQCVYCNFMNQSISKVVEHCVQTHPDFHILYYVPEPLVTSTHSPIRAQQFTEFDAFNPSTETQDNCVTSTESSENQNRSNNSEAIKAWEKNKQVCDKEVQELGFHKKPRVSTVNKSTSAAVASGLSNKHLNKESVPSASGYRRNIVKSPYFGLQKLGGPSTSTNRLNQLPKRNDQNSRAMPKSAKMNYLKRNADKIGKRKNVYESEEDSDESIPKKVPKKPEQSSLPSMISPKKVIEKQMICKLCFGTNTGEFKESQISSHIAIYHKIEHRISKTNCVPFMCGYCRNFFDSESTASVVAHQKSQCNERPDNSETFVDKMIVTKEEYLRNRAKERPTEASTSRKRSEDRCNERSDDRTPNRSSDRPKKPKGKSPRVTLLSDDEYEELTQSSSSTPLVKKQSSTEQKQRKVIKNQNKDNRDNKDNTQNKPSRVRNESSSSTGYVSSDSITSIPESIKEVNENEFTRRQSTSRKTTTIEVAEPEEEGHQYVCLFCDQSYIKKGEAIEHLESHFPEINGAKETVSSLNSWFTTFISKQMSLFEDERGNDDNDYYYKCPICVRIARIKQLRPKRFRSFWQMESHFWEHTLWTPVTCLFCKSNNDLPNCDHLIAKHLNSKHSEDLMESEDTAINLLYGNKVRDEFSDEQREALKENKFIRIYSYETIDSQIENVLQQIKGEREAYLRQKIEKESKFKINLPKLILKPLPRLNFDDEDMVIGFIETNERENRLKRKEEKKSSKSVPKKPLDEIDLGSDSWDDSDDEQQTVIIRKKATKPTFDVSDDSDDEPNDNNRIDSSDNEDIDLIEKTSKSGSNSKQKRNSNKSDDCSDEELRNDLKDNKNRDKLKPKKSVTFEDKEEANQKSKEKESQQLRDKTEKRGESSNNQNNDNPIDETPERVVPKTEPVIKETISPIKRYKCGNCSQTFENSKDAKNHSKEQHSDLPIRYTRI